MASNSSQHKQKMEKIKRETAKREIQEKDRQIKALKEQIESQKPNSDKCIGIDLGTTNSVVAVLESSDYVRIIPDEKGSKLTPSVVAFEKIDQNTFKPELERVVGMEAKIDAKSLPASTVYDSKRLIGRRYKEVTVQQDMKNWPFKVVDKGGRPEISIAANNKCYTPEQISGYILEKIKDIASQHLRTEVKKAVITVPAYFNNGQRQATIEAGTKAGLEVMHIINEPTAAAIAYGLKTEDKPKRNVVVYDLGGGTFDVSVLKIDGKNIEVISTSGDTHLGGEDINNKIVEKILSDYEEKGKVLQGDEESRKLARRRLSEKCEKAKIELSSNEEARIEMMEFFGEGEDIDITLKQGEFEQLIEDLIQNTLDIVNKALSDKHVEKESIDEILMVGGTTYIPLVRKMVRDFFGKDVNTSMNPEEAVAYGAAIAAAEEGVDPDAPGMNLIDITPLSIGIETIDCDNAGPLLMSTIIPKGTQIPFKEFKQYTTYVDNQTELNIKIYEGEEKYVKDNHFLDRFNLIGIPPMPAGEPEILVTCNINHNGILNVKAQEKSTGLSKGISITKHSANMAK